MHRSSRPFPARAAAPRPATARSATARPAPPPGPSRIPDHVALAAEGGADEAQARWEALLDAGLIGRPRDPAAMPDYRKLDRLFGLDRVGCW